MSEFTRAILSIVAPYAGFVIGGGGTILLIVICTRIARSRRHSARMRRGIHTWDVFDIIDEL